MISINSDFHINYLVIYCTYINQAQNDNDNKNLKKSEYWRSCGNDTVSTARLKSEYWRSCGNDTGSTARLNIVNQNATNAPFWQMISGSYFNSTFICIALDNNAREYGNETTTIWRAVWK